MKTLLVTQAPTTYIMFSEALRAENGGPILRALGDGEALEMAASDKPDLVIIDGESGDGDARQLVRRLLAVDAFINVAVMSPLSNEEFHRAYEGLGILARLSCRPGRADALALAERYRRVAEAA
jgi:DNA-binding response OmpR family regulator